MAEVVGAGMRQAGVETIEHSLSSAVTPARLYSDSLIQPAERLRHVLSGSADTDAAGLTGPTTVTRMPARSLAEDLRARDDDALAALLHARPDLVSPVPPDISALAARAASRASAARALDRLDLFTLQTVDVLCALPEPTTVASVSQLLGADARGPLDALREQALVWGGDDDLRTVRTVRDIVASPAGLGPPAEQVLAAYGPARLSILLADLDLPATGNPGDAAGRIAALIRDGSSVDRLLAAAPPDAREVLARLTWGPPTGTVADAGRAVSADGARGPVEWLICAGATCMRNRPPRPLR